MNTVMLRRARRHFQHAMAPVSVQRHNMRAWARSIRLLGDHWLLHKSINKSGSNT